MRNIHTFLLVAGLLILIGCNSSLNDPVTETKSNSPKSATTFTDVLVETSCGECQFAMEGASCDLAVRIDGKSYFVDGSSIDDHGDAHGDSGLCNCIRQARVSGEIKGDRFVATSLKLLPNDKKADAGSAPDKKVDQ